MTEQPPIRATLVGREAYEPEYVEDAPPPEGLAIPSGCSRHLNIPDHVCEVECPGRQRDGGCFAELVRGREGWSVTLDVDGFWILSG